MTTDKALHILVGIDLSEMDQHLIDYMGVLDHILNIEKITFIHNLKLGELPKELVQPERIELLKTRIAEKVKRMIGSTSATYQYEVQVHCESYSEVAFMNITKKHPFDLLVLGNKQELEGNGGLADKLVRIIPAATLLVPETYQTPVTTIIDAIDFSRYTSLIMGWADRFKNNSKGQKIVHSAVHVSKFYWGFYPTMTEKEWEKATREDIKEKQDKWNKKYANYSDIEIVPAEDKNISASLIQYARRKKADLMILGVKGSTGIKEIFLGSVANHLLHRPTNTCLLFVKAPKA
ncbi:MULTISPECIES: universal stress protein [Myroides]|uniref:universal stress protein n=1 Tax=Myroides TaxID=76831 RepID=UPI00132B0660|nr:MULTISPECIES: universal stress protein [Myroides]MVX35369.1 universal stress protein [Myroides sp. LoEW2-1]UVD78311.1 universal stress protein [Myroides albus]